MPKVAYKERVGAVDTRTSRKGGEVEQQVALLSVTDLLQQVDTQPALSQLIFKTPCTEITQVHSMPKGTLLSETSMTTVALAPPRPARPTRTRTGTALTCPPRPLSPRYQASVPVMQVWQPDYGADTFERTVYPPGFVNLGAYEEVY